MLNLSLSSDWLSINNLWLTLNEVDLFGVINNSSLVDWLGEDFFCWSLKVFVKLLVGVFGWSGDGRVIDCSGLSSIDL